MNENFTSSFKDHDTGDIYQIRFEWIPGNLLKLRRGQYKLFCELRPDCPYKLRDGHLFAEGEICIKDGQEPRTKDRAKAFALLWMRRFSRFCRTGNFDNDAGKVNVV